MAQRIALFRGINVGGRNSLPMAKLKSILTDLGCSEVQTYIQSGNVVFQHSQRDLSSLASKMTAAIERECEFAPNVLILSAETLASAIENNPYRDIATEEKAVHFLFLSAAAKEDAVTNISAELTPTESCALIDDVLYLYAPDGIGRSNAAAKAERYLGVPTTGRNMRTVNKLAEMVAT